jgi:hypothetical protein
MSFKAIKIDSEYLFILLDECCNHGIELAFPHEEQQ